MIEVLKQALEALEFFSDTSNSAMDKAMSEDAITSIRQAIAELESQEPVVTVPRRLALNTWAFLAQDCSPCAHEECQIGLKNVGVDTLTDAWNKQLAGNTHPPQEQQSCDKRTEQELVATLLRQSKQNFERNFGSNGYADWIYKDIAELMDTPPAQPPQRTWQGLTDEEIIDVIHPLVMADMTDQATDYEIAKAIEAKLKELNS